MPQHKVNVSEYAGEGEVLAIPRGQLDHSICSEFAQEFVAPDEMPVPQPSDRNTQNWVESNAIVSNELFFNV